jgi:predicted enzyme related to lactoylglutathione lyase
MAGSLVHFELPSEDAGRVEQFWSGVFGWTFNDPGNDLSLFQRDDSGSA